MLADEETVLGAGKSEVEPIVEEEASVTSVPSVCGLLEQGGGTKIDQYLICTIS